MTMAENKDKKVLNVPHLRFPEFSGEWENHVLQDTVTFSNGKAHENCVNEDGDYILVNSKFVSTNGQIQKRVTSQLSPLCKSQFVMVMSDLPNGKALAKCYYIEEDNKFTLNQRICSFSAKNGNISKFLMYQINRNKYYMRFDDGINQTNLKKNEVLSCPVFIPSIKEQEKIATLLHLIDERITTQNKIIEDLKKLKSAIIDYAVNSLDIDTVKFSSLYKTAGEGGTPSTSNVDFYENGQIPFIKIDDLKQKYLTENKDFITELGLQKSSAWLVPTNSILFSNGATIGEISITTYPVCTKQGILGIVPKSHVDVDYLYYFMSSAYFRKEVCRIVTEGTMKTAYLKDINNITCPIPTKETQQEIAKMPSLLNSKIELEQDILDMLNKQKRYLLSHMFI